MKFLSLSLLALASQVANVYSAAISVPENAAVDAPTPIPSSTADDVPSHVKRASPWPTHLPNNWIAYSQTGGALGGPIVSAMVTIGLTNPSLNPSAIIQAFQNSGENMVAAYGHSTWYHLAHLAGLQSSMAIVKVTGYYDYQWITDAAANSGYMTIMLRFNMLSGTAASIAPTVARALASYYGIGHIEANYNPVRTNAKRDAPEEDGEWKGMSVNPANSALHAKRDSCFHAVSTDARGKVDRYASYVPRSTSCELHA